MNTNLPWGLLYGMSAAAYHSDPGVSNSMLSSLNKSPAHCYALHLAPDRPERVATPAMKAGTLAHTLILEPEAFAQRYAVRPPGMKFSTREGAAWRDAQTLEIIDSDDMETAASQRDAVMRVPALAKLLSSGDSETSVFWKHAATGLRCRARPDRLKWVGEKRVIALDIKTISDLTTDIIERSIAAYGYHRQAAHYSDGLAAVGLEVEEFVFGFVSSSYPFLAAAFVLDDDSLQQGRDEVAELLEQYANCARAGTWPAFGDGYQAAGLPKWARRTNELEVSYV